MEGGTRKEDHSWATECLARWGLQIEETGRLRAHRTREKGWGSSSPIKPGIEGLARLSRKKGPSHKTFRIKGGRMAINEGLLEVRSYADEMRTILNRQRRARKQRKNS